MKKIIKLCLLLLTIFITTNAYAASVSISTKNTNVYVGDSVTVSVNIFAGTWNLKVSGGGVSDSIVGYNMDGNTTTTKSYKIDTSTVGTKTVTLTGDISDYDTEVTTRGISKSVTINVTAAPVVPTTTQVVTTTPVAPPTTGAKTTKKTTTKTTVTTTQPIEEPTTTVINKESVIKINEFKIVGYNIDFNKDIKEYTIDVNENVEELYVIVSGDEINVENSGIINIKDKESFDVIIKHGHEELVYTIYIERGSVKGVATTNNQAPDKYILTIIILSVVIIGLIVILLYYLLTVKKGI